MLIVDDLTRAIVCTTIGASSCRRLPYIRPHDLRRTAATLALLKGVHPKKVSKMLGHSSVAITLSLYSHVLPTLQRDVTEAMDELFLSPDDVGESGKGIH